MKNGNYSKAKVLTLIPIIVLAVTVICMVLAVKAAKEGTAGTLKYLLLGIMEIFAYAMGAIMAVRMIIAVQGV